MEIEELAKRIVQDFRELNEQGNLERCSMLLEYLSSLLTAKRKLREATPYPIRHTKYNST